MIKPWIIPDMDKVMLNKVTSHEMSSSVSNFNCRPRLLMLGGPRMFFPRIASVVHFVRTAASTRIIL